MPYGGIGSETSQLRDYLAYYALPRHPIFGNASA